MILLNISDGKFEYIRDKNRFECNKDEIIEVLKEESEIYIYGLNKEDLIELNIGNKAVYDCQTVYILISGIVDDFIEYLSVCSKEVVILKHIVDSIENTDDILEKINYIFSYKEDIVKMDFIYLNIEARRDIEDILNNININDTESFIDDLNEVKSIIEEVNNRQDIFSRFKII